MSTDFLDSSGVKSTNKCFFGVFTKFTSIVFEKILLGQKVSPAEHKLFDTYPEHGARLISRIPRMEDVAKIVENQNISLLQTIYETLLEIRKTDQVTEHVTDQVERLIQALGNDTLTAKEIMDKLNLKHRDTFRKNYLLPSIAEGFVEMTIPEKPKSNKQKYRLKKKI